MPNTLMMDTVKINNYEVVRVNKPKRFVP